MLERKRLEVDVRLNKQMGWECQITALSGVLDFLYNNNLLHKKPLGLRKRFDTNASDSIRSLAKSKFHSTVGEMNNIYDVVKLAKINPEIAASAITCENAEQYCQIIVDAINHNLAPIIFFEVNPKWGPAYGQPRTQTGDNDHSAVVVGYNHDEYGRLTFTISQWQDEFEVDALSLFNSSNQKRKIGIDEFQKVLTRNSRDHAWIPKNYMHMFFDNPEIAKSRKAKQDIRNGFFTTSILIVDSIHKFDYFVKKLSDNIQELKKDDSQLAHVKRKNLSQLKEALTHNKKRETLFKLVESWKKAPANFMNKTNEELLGDTPSLKY